MMTLNSWRYSWFYKFKLWKWNFEKSQIFNFELNSELIAVFWEVRKWLKPGVDFGNEIASTW